MHSSRKAWSLSVISCLCLVAGLIVAGLMRGWIIVQLPVRRMPFVDTITAQQKTCILWFWSPNTHMWKSEKKSCVWSHDTASAIEHLVNAWLTVLEEESILKEPTKLINALISQEQTAYLSFDHSPFNREDSLQTQWFFVEGLLKTIRQQAPDIRQVMLLVNNQPLASRHLDCEHPWPSQGFADNVSL